MDNFENSSREFPSNAYKLTQNFVEKELNLVGSNFYRLSGYDFLHFISELCAQLTGFDCVFIADFNPESNKITIKAGIENSKRAEIAEFNINGKPIKHILRNQFVIYPENVQAKFPEDTELKKHNIQGFAGVPLLNNNGDVLGMFYAYHSKVITDIESIETYLKLFSGRISSELNLIKKEELLIRSEKKYQTLFESANDTILLMKGANIIECNSKTLEMFGCGDKDDIIGKTVIDFSPEKQPDGTFSDKKAMQFINEVEKGFPQRFYWKHSRKDGTTFDTEVSLNPLKLEGTIHFQAIVRDITQKKQSNELARKLSTAVEQSSASIIITNTSGQIEYVNPKFTQVTGYTFDEVAGKNPRFLKSGYTDGVEYKRLWETILAGNIWKGEFKNTRKNGEYYWESVSIAPIVNEFGDITHFVAIKEDITKRKNVELLLKQSEERYRSVFENLHDVLYITDLNGTILELSPSIQFHFGYNRDKLLGTSVYDVYYDASEREKFLNTIKQKGLVNDYELALKNEYGEKVYCSANARLIFDENGKPVQVEGIIRNITGRKLNEKKLQLSERRFRQAQEVAKIGTFEFDIKNGIYWGSVEAKKIFGFSIDDDNFPVKQVRECYVDKEKTGAMIDDAHKNLDSYNYEYDIFTYDTHERKTINSIAEIKRNKEGKPEKVLGLIVDVTEKKQIEKELIAAKERAEENEKKLREASEIAKLGSWELNINTREFTFTDSLFKIYGTTASEMGGYKISVEDYYKLFVHPDDLQMVIEEIKNAYNSTKQSTSHYVEHRIRYHNGGTGYVGVWLFFIKDKFGNIIKSYGVNQDITKIKIAEQEILKAKEKAEESERFYRTMNENLPLGIHYYKLDNNNNLILTGANPAANKILGVDNARFIGKTIEDAFPDLTKTEVSQRYRDTASKGISWTTELIFSNENTINGVYDVVAYQTTPGSMVSVFSDITSRKQAESELIKAKEKAEKNEKKLKEASEIAKLGSWEFDIETNLFTFTDNFYKIFHTSATEMGGYQMTIEDYFKQFIHPDDADLVARETKKAAESSDPNFSNYFEHKIVYKDGGTGYIAVRFFMSKDKFSNSIKCYGVNQDITSRKIAENELIKAKEQAEENEIRFKSISENANDGITLADLDGNYVFANNAFAELTKYSIPEILQLKVFDIAKPDKNSSYQFNKIAANQAYSIRRELTCKDNSVIIADIHGKIIEISGEKLALGIIRDVTDIVKWENELINAKEKAEESDKLKTAFLLNVSHEIRTPMNGILGFLDLLKKPDLSDIEKSDFLNLVNKSGERLMNTINDIVEISKIETGDTNLVIQEMDISEVMQYHYNFFRLEAERKGLKLIIKEQIKGNPALIKTDKHKLDGILMNLIKNAIKFTVNGKIEFGNYLENDKICFYVADTGVGIPEDKMNVIFERFVQAETGLNRNYEGSGIGLSIVKAHVEAMNGEIEVESETGTGSTFRFSIPYTPINIAANSHKNGAPTLNEITNQGKLLIVEDDEVNTYLMKSMLSNDFKLLFATNGEESIQVLQDNPDISLILMDIKMPGKYDGLETTRKIRQFNKKIPIIAQTAYAQSSDKIKAIDAGCNDYISKPFNANQLKTVIRKYCKVNK